MLVGGGKALEGICHAFRKDRVHLLLHKGFELLLDRRLADAIFKVATNCDSVDSAHAHKLLRLPPGGYVGNLPQGDAHRRDQRGDHLVGNHVVGHIPLDAVAVDRDGNLPVAVPQAGNLLAPESA